MEDYSTIYNYMDSQVNEFIDPMTGELDCTSLVEDAADHFGLGEDIPEIYFDIAVDVEVSLLGNSFEKDF